MPFYNRLWLRLFASQFVVAFVGVGIMMLATRIVALNSAPIVIRPLLAGLLTEPDLTVQTEQALIVAFRNAVLFSVAIAAVGAIAAGLVSSYVIWLTLIAPLRQMAASSYRIAQGRYGERVVVPENSGETIAHLVINFNQMAEALEQIEMQRVTLLGNISHELRTPLTALKGYLEGLVDGLFPNSQETFGWMLAELHRLTRLVDDLHNLSRAESGRTRFTMRDFDLRVAAERIWTQLGPQAREEGIELRIQLPDNDVLVHADPDRTAQILINLVDNALRYTPPEGVVEITVAQDQQQARAVVADTGIGIPAEALPYLFERFYRVDRSRARSSGGSGIGLTISRHLAWMMGGELEAASGGEGKGSTFTFTLPLSDP